MTTLADDIVAEIAASWNTGIIAKPTLSVKEDKQADLKIGFGYVDSGDESLEQDILGTTGFGQRETSFEIHIACDSDVSYGKYQSEVERIIFAKTVTAGWWEITNYPADRTLRRQMFHAIGKQIKYS